MATYQLSSNILIQQIPSDKYPDRNLLIEFSFLNKYEGSSTWADLTQTMCITLPKKIVTRARKEGGIPFFFQINAENTNSGNLGGFDSAPAFMRGDLIKFNIGYSCIINNNQVAITTGDGISPELFAGVISRVAPNFPFTIECEDYMWLLKQMPTPAKNWGNVTLQKIVKDVMDSSASLPIITRYKNFINLTVSDFSTTDLKFNVNNFTTTRGSLAAMLARIKSEYRVDSYFRGQELRIGYLHYVADDSVNHTFTFQQNILDDNNLEWQRRDDAVLSMIVRSNYLVAEGGTTSDGITKTTHKSTEILIYNNAGVFTYITKEKGKDFPTKYLNDIGERFTMNIFDAITDPAKLFEIGRPQLSKYYYNGFKGSFTTFGFPYVKHGDTVQLVNNMLPELTGFYKVKAVKYFGGVDSGYKQTITLDYKI